MPQNNQQNRRIDFINIDCESNYFDTREQVKIRNNRAFTDTSIAAQVTGSSTVTGLFSRSRVVKDDVIYNSPIFATSSTGTDSSGNSRKILASNVDYYASSSIDSYRNGIEITQDKHWAAGLAKITAGTPGHLYTSTLFGVSDNDIISPDAFTELSLFDPVKFVVTGGDPEFFTYPIVTSNGVLAEALDENGIIEPFPIRSVISNRSLNFPYEPHATRGQFGNGNINNRFATDSVLSLDYFSPNKRNSTPYFDLVTQTGLSGSLILMSGEETWGRTTEDDLYFVEHVAIEENLISPHEDIPYPRGEVPDTNTYTGDLLAAVNAMLPGGTTYVNRKEKSATCGFVYDNSPQGTDSIAYGGLLY